MKNSEIKKLDLLYQTLLLFKYKHRSILGGEATLIHHYIHKSSGLRMRWWLPNGLPMNLDQHNVMHSSDKRKEGYNDVIIAIKGERWKKELEDRKWKMANHKKVEFNDVMRYLNGERNDYI